MTGELNKMSGNKWHRTEEGKLSFKNKMVGFSSLENKTQEEKIIIFEKISKTLTDYKWNDEEKEKRKIGMLKVWEERRIKNFTKPEYCKIEIKITNIITKIENVFNTKKDAAKYLNVTRAKFYKKYTDNTIIGDNKIEFIKK